MTESKLVNGMNSSEQFIQTQYPMLRRISSAQSPREIEVSVVLRHNPDFAFFNPSEGKGIYVEVKGVIFNKMWLPMLATTPRWFKQIYKVILVTRSKKERNKIKRSLDKIDIEWYDDVMNPEWIEFAAKLYTGQIVLDFDDEDNSMIKPCPNFPK